MCPAIQWRWQQRSCHYVADLIQKWVTGFWVLSLGWVFQLAGVEWQQQYHMESSGSGHNVCYCYSVWDGFLRQCFGLIHLCDHQVIKRNQQNSSSVTTCISTTTTTTTTVTQPLSSSSISKLTTAGHQVRSAYFYSCQPFESTTIGQQFIVSYV